MANYNFNKDLDLGINGECIIQKDLERLGGILISNNDNNTHDLKMQMPDRTDGFKIITYEIKTDTYCRPYKDTNNMFIEFECRGKLSGISVTKADWFVMYYPYLKDAWYIKTSKLKKIISENDFKIIEQGGDVGSATKGYLIPRYQFKKYFKVRLIPKNHIK